MEATERDFPDLSGSPRTLSEAALILPAQDPISRNSFIESACMLEARFEAQRDFSPKVYWTRLLEAACSQLGAMEGTPNLIESYDRELRELEASYRLMYSKLDDQLVLRGRPIQEYWSGFGRGLMAHIKRLTQPEWLVPSATVVLVQPILGGTGIAYPACRVILLEAMLTNVTPELPEVLRVAWLASQLATESLAECTELPLPHLSKTVGIAMMMCTLAAGEVLELCRCDEATITKAIDLWKLQPDGSIGEKKIIAKVVVGWWETYLQTRPTLSVSLVALNKMLQRD